MVNHKNIKLVLVEATYSQGTKKYNKMEAMYVYYLKILKHKRDPEDHIRYVAKQRTPDEATYTERMADYKDWYNEEVYASLEKLYKLYLELANQEEIIQKRSKEEVNNILQRIHGLEI